VNLKLIKLKLDAVNINFAGAGAEAKHHRKQAGIWLKELRAQAGISQVDLARRLNMKYYTFISQVENGFGRVPTESMEAWAEALGVEPGTFARKLISYYDPELYRLLLGNKP
jgi:transcriptional regulator with XRE-family HTH domain